MPKPKPFTIQRELCIITNGLMQLRIPQPTIDNLVAHQSNELITLYRTLKQSGRYQTDFEAIAEMYRIINKK